MIKNIENQIPSVTNLTTNTAISAPDNNIPNVSNLVKKKKKVYKAKIRVRP